jgi:solute:Na+ symporter, SSS family
MRVFSAFFVILSVILALLRPDTIVAILGISWGAIGSTFLGPFIWGLYWKKTNKAAAITSMILGLGTCLGLYISGFPSPEAGTIGMGISLVAPPLISLATGSKKVIVTK